MKSISIILFLTVINVFQAISQQAESVISGVPDRIMLNVPGDPATTAAVSWRTVFEDTVSIGQIARVNAFPLLEHEAVTVRGVCSPWETGTVSSMGHKVFFDNLLPETQYAYRVGNGTRWSEWFHFRTASDKVKPFSFLYMGDVQDDILSLGSRIMRQAWSHFPDSRFILFAGDLVTRSADLLWQEFFDAGGWIFGMVPSFPTPGNHEYYAADGQIYRPFSSQWNQIFSLPHNGPAPRYNERIYFMDYQGTRFISVDSPAMMNNQQDTALILNWLDETLASNPNRWSVVLTHFPVYSCSRGRNYENYRNAIQPILEKHGVDIVLQGHDHTYCRGQNPEMAGKDSKNLPMYVVSVAGRKMYGLNASLWADRVASETPLYQHIEISGDTLDFRAFTVAGDLYDAFSLIKNDGAMNELVEYPETLVSH
jgi:3',5'-cyclic AMP phosphodiesterase CpdA